MADISIDDLSSQYFDVLKEIGNIGAGNATTALSTMLGGKVDMSVPKVRLMEFKDVGTTMGGEEQIVAGIYLVVQGDNDQRDGDTEQEAAQQHHSLGGASLLGAFCSHELGGDARPCLGEGVNCHEECAQDGH